METDLLSFAVVMACIAMAVAVYCLVTEAREGWRISRLGWVRGHSEHHTPHLHN